MKRPTDVGIDVKIIQDQTSKVDKLENLKQIFGRK